MPFAPPAPSSEHNHARYDLAGDLTSFANGIGVTFSYANDTAARPTQITSSLVDSQHPATLATVDSSVGYYPHGALRKMTFGNGLTQATEIESRLQPCEINVNSSGSLLTACGATPSGNIQDHHYSFGSWGSTNNGDVTAWIASGTQNFNRSYSYDSLDRVSSLSSPSDPNGCTGLSWTYDAWGNRTDQTVTGGSCPTFHQAVNTQNRLSSSPYQYDAAGNLTNDGNHTYFYDAENRLAQVDGTFGTCSTATACYQYDAFGRRVEKTTGSTTVDYIYDLAGEVTGEWLTEPGFTGQLAHYIYLNGRVVAEYTNGTTYFVHGDHLGSTRLLTDLNQSVVQHLDYLPFGELNSTDSGITTHKFTGDEHDSETNLEHTWFRKYSSSLGRWMTPDPAGLAAVDPSNPQTWNRYAYVGNRPLNNKDPLGLCPIGGCYSIWAGGGGVGSGGGGGGGGFDCSEDGISVACGMISNNGNTIFDAIRGVPGTYLTLDIHGNIGYGFSETLYTTTLSLVDYLRIAGAWSGDLAEYPSVGFQVYVTDHGAFQETSGLIPDAAAALAEQAMLWQSLPSGAHEFYRDLLQNGVGAPDALAITLDYTIARDPGYASWVSAWGQVQQQLSSYLNQIMNVVYGPGH